MSSDSSPPRRLTGPRVVFLMFGFGILMVSVLWIYFEYQTRRFRDLTIALAAEFPESRPLVQGGQEQLDDANEPMILRILVTVKFDPREEQAFRQAVQRIREITAEHHDLKAYDQLEVHLIQRIPEQEPIARATILQL